MKPDRLARRWNRRHKRLLADLRQLLPHCRRSGQATQVHELRVTLRRLRLSVRVGKGFFDEALVARLRDWTRRISQATSPVRDLDIATEWLERSQAGATLLDEIRKRRDQAWHRRRRQVTPPPAGLLAALAKPGVGRHSAALARRARKLEGRYRDRIRELFPDFFELPEEDRHDLRRTVRWWRYLRELELPRKQPGRDRVFRRLLATQESLGDLQNLGLVQGAMQRLSPSPERDELFTLLSQQQQQQLGATRRALLALKKWLR